MLTFVLIAFPTAYLALLASLLARRRFGAAAASAALFVATFLSGSMQVRHSHSSTAGIAYLFLPSAAAVAGILGAACGAAVRGKPPMIRAAGAVCGLAAIGIAVWVGHG